MFKDSKRLPTEQPKVTTLSEEFEEYTHQVEYDLRRPKNLPKYLGYLSIKEIRERSKRVDEFLSQF